MKNASQILESKGYEGDEVDSIITWTTEGQASLDALTRTEFGFESEPVQWDAYYLGDADEEIMNKIASMKGFDDYTELLNAATNHLNQLAANYPIK